MSKILLKIPELVAACEKHEHGWVAICPLPPSKDTDEARGERAVTSERKGSSRRLLWGMIKRESSMRVPADVPVDELTAKPWELTSSAMMIGVSETKGIRPRQIASPTAPTPFICIGGGHVREKVRQKAKVAGA